MPPSGGLSYLLELRRPDGTWVSVPQSGAGDAFRAYGDRQALAVDGNSFAWSFDGTSWTSLGQWRPGGFTYAIASDGAGNVWVSGTGGAARSPLIQVAGKTGTAQVIEMKGAYLKSEQLSYFNRDHAWFVSYAPVDKPQIAVAVLVEHGGHGGSAAAPLAKKVFEKFVEQTQKATDKQQVSADGAIRAN